MTEKIYTIYLFFKLFTIVYTEETPLSNLMWGKAHSFFAPIGQ